MPSWLDKIRRGLVPRRILCAATATLLLTSCSADYSASRTRHADTKGPLSATSAEGGFAGEAVTSGTEYRSFGANLLCMHEKGTEIVLERAIYQAKVKPIEAEFWLRTVKAEDIVMDGDEIASPYVPFISATGRPSNYAGERTKYAGTHTRSIAGTKITQSCDELRKAKTGFTDLILAMKVDENGAHIPEMTIEYTADGKEYALNTRWEIIVCGSHIIPEEGEEYCHDGALNP